VVIPPDNGEHWKVFRFGAVCQNGNFHTSSRGLMDGVNECLGGDKVGIDDIQAPYHGYAVIGFSIHDPHFHMESLVLVGHSFRGVLHGDRHFIQPLKEKGKMIEPFNRFLKQILFSC
jgi:hypothetical protein